MKSLKNRFTPPFLRGYRNGQLVWNGLTVYMDDCFMNVWAYQANNPKEYYNELLLVGAIMHIFTLSDKSLWD